MTKEILADSFREIANDKPIGKITVKEITDNCGFSPTTFYRHFKDKYDLIVWDYVHQTNEIMSRVGTDGYEWKNTVTDAASFFCENRAYIQNLLRNTSGHDAFIRHSSEANVRHLTNCILKLSGKQALDADTEIFVRIYCYGTIQTVCAWLLGDITCDKDHLAELCVRALPTPLYGILCGK